MCCENEKAIYSLSFFIVVCLNFLGKRIIYVNIFLIPLRIWSMGLLDVDEWKYYP